MPQWHDDQTKRKISGGKKKPYRGKRKFDSGGYSAETVLGERKKRSVRGRGGSIKIRLLSDNHANVTISSAGRTEKVEIERVVRNPVNVDYDRRRIITRGAIIATQLGEAVVTSRPGQDGVINALLLKSRS